MPVKSHQTVRLSRGKHPSPEFGACVMELASMLAGEPFSDHPRSVSRTIASFLRCYNDKLDDKRRQDLYAYAAKVVGSVRSPEVEYARASRLVQWIDAEGMRRARWPLGARRHARPEHRVNPESAARYAIRALRRVSDETHKKVLALIDELIALGGPADRVRAEDSLPDAFRPQPGWSAHAR